jgi:hypothetical protein
MRRTLVCAVAAAAICVEGIGHAAFAAMAEPAAAEYAIRWNARDGGPASVNETLALLKSRATRVRRFNVDYYDLPPTMTAPPGFAMILRRRIEDGAGAELTWKLRGDHALADWTCPLRNSKESKSEVDVAFHGADAFTRAFSYSCTSDGRDPAASGLSATLKPCTVAMSRRVAGKIRIEEWRLPGDVLVIEVSGSGANSPGAMEQFRKVIVAPLVAAGVVPTASSKTDLGSRCNQPA